MRNGVLCILEVCSAVRFHVRHTRSVTKANGMLHAAWDLSWKTAVLAHSRIWGIPKILHLVKNRASLYGATVINFWDLLRYDTLLRKSFHTDENCFSNSTIFCQAEETPARKRSCQWLFIRKCNGYWMMTYRCRQRSVRSERRERLKACFCEWWE